MRELPRRAWMCALGAVVVAAIVVVAQQSGSGETSRVMNRSSSTLLRPKPALPEPDANVFEPLSAEEALMANARIPFAPVPIQPAAPFKARNDVAGILAQTAALDCLTAAVYYEAASEGETGERAVAQVVLNRVRHPAFPASVCGVVYQGSERTTGCQFTFTCDGSLRRQPSPSGWALARKVAAAALAGKIDRAVGTATHYHADFVLPYWAPKLDKIAVVGRHIFYKWRGFWGQRQAFNQRYVGEEISTAALVDPSALDVASTAMSGVPVVTSRPGLPADETAGEIVAPLNSDGLPSVGTLQADKTKTRLRADELQPVLGIDGDNLKATH